MSTIDTVATEVSTQDLADVFPHLTAMIRAMEARTVFQEATGADFVKQIMEGILSAESFDDVFDAQTSGMTSGKDMDSRPFYIRSVEDIEWKKSALNAGNADRFPYYAMVKATEIATGEEVIFNCGGATFVPTLWRLSEGRNGVSYFEEDENKYPNGRALVIQSVPSPAGAYLLLKPYKVPAAPTSRGKK